VTEVFQCQRCAACCRWPGEVRLTEEEIAQLAAFKGLQVVDFIQQYTRLNKNRIGLALTDKPNGECIFLDGKDCLIQSVKPKQCRDFPNGWSFEGVERDCRAVKAALSSPLC
jgi:Fe-S-cluster containining protein